MSKLDTAANSENLSEAQKEQLSLMEGMASVTPGTDAEVGTLVSGKVVSISGESILVDIALRNEALLPKSEVLDENGVLTVKEGDTMDLYVVSVSDDEIIVSRSMKSGKAGKALLRDLLDRQVPVEGRITGMNKGGFNVTILERKAFCPFSSIDIQYPENPADFMAKTMDFVIARIENRGNNIVLTRLPLLSGDVEERLTKLEESLANGEAVSGTVTRVTNFGAFVDLGGIEGLVHVSELSWDRDASAESLVKSGAALTLKILKIERHEVLRDTRISLSVKRLESDPWENALATLSVGDMVDAEVSRLVGFGAFVKLFAGVEALVRTEEMGWGRVRKPSDVVNKGETVRVTIISIDAESHKIDCSLKDIALDPWGGIAEKYAVESLVMGTVADEKSYGFFVDLDDDITGLLQKRRIGNDKKKETLRKGDKIEVRIDTVDTAERRISLSYGDVAPEEERHSHRDAAVQYMKKQKEHRASSNQVSDFGAMLMNAMKK